MSYAKNQARRLGRKSLGSSDRYVRLEFFLLNSLAYKSLDPVARCLYTEIKKRYRGPGTNNGSISYSVREAADELRIGKATAKRALDALQDRGFIVATTKGNFDFKIKHATEWRLTEYPCDLSNQLPTKDFMSWRPEIQNSVPVTEPHGSTTGTVRLRRAG